MATVEIRDLDVIFGKNKAETLKLMDQGLSRSEIRKRNGDVVGVKGATISVESGEICVLMGLSGSGKSSLLRTVNGLNDIARGELWVEDGDRRVNVASCDEATLRHLRTHRVSMVFQKFALMPWLTVAENVAFGLEMQGMSRKEWTKQVEEKLELVGLFEWRNLKPNELSGGMQQRVGLARAFTMDTDILLMDEPFSALDPLIRSQLQDELITLQKRLNKTILFVSHDLDEALKIGTHIAIMESAQIVQAGAPEDIVLHPSNDYVKNFVAHTNPLKVLKGKSLMTPLDRLAEDPVSHQIDIGSAMCLVKNEQGKIVALKSHTATVPFTDWQCNGSMDDIQKGMAVMAPAEIGMREAMEIRYRTGLPVCLEQEGNCVGVLTDEDYYEALI
ncbi:ABC transporter ATP-binding protein [Pokkaliibacter plantistimulans]|uniref:ABC transporter ATP-binding protein n=2 Tax=Pseudomonadota TaxID=1224 RepID=A0ABX5M042_9GAMM|nr:choline ABC transporter ATP-binding protein [Pokkaliibacter plantistimulans]PPC77069.1 choline ABC transporter ATP-binding protein [Pokkaliibacter plantistimulans]PXF32284.1 ABC transporter ATP-binding protein [Pokkaliibacter plantistimulans]